MLWWSSTKLTTKLKLKNIFLIELTTYKILENDRQEYLQNKVIKLLQKLKSQKKIEK